MSYQHLQIERDGALACLKLNYQGKSANVLSQEMIAELIVALDEIEEWNELTGFILQSEKPSGFVFGADITEFESLSSESDVRHLQENAMRLLDRITNSTLVSVALLHGPALGGGLELALACDYRLVAEEGRLMIGFPEANLGLMPGFAGTARAARLIGGKATIDLCLSAKPVTTQDDALAYGLADGRYTAPDAISQARNFISKGKRASETFCDAGNWQEIISAAQERYLAGRRLEHIPHISALITHFKEAGPDYDKLISGELTHFPKLMRSAVSANLRRVFALTDKVKKQARGPSPISHVHVIGAGVMGADIATFLCFKGMHIYLSDNDNASLSKAQKTAHQYFDRKLSPAKAAEAKTRFVCGLPHEMAEHVELVIEAVSEKMSVKQAVWQNLESTHSARCLFATNSSALDLEEISRVMTNPERLMGVHFFNPATVMPLIELIHRPETDQDDFNILKQFALQIGKLPISVQNSPGFLVNRALLPYIFEAIAMMLEGIAADEIDEALLSYGMPMGPIELADQIGLDICSDVGDRLGIPETVKEYLKSKIQAQELGRKTAVGSYQWDGKRAERARASYDKRRAEDIITRTLAPLIQACRDCLSEGHVTDADFVDAAMIFGTGYPRHTGGPLHDAKARHI